MRIQRDRDGQCTRDRLMDGTTMRDFQQPLFLLGWNSMGKMDGNIDPADTVRTFSHGPFRIDTQPIPRNIVSRTKLAYEVRHAARHGADEEFNRTHSGILPTILRRLIGDDAMFAAVYVVASPAVIGHCEFHLPRHLPNLLIW